MNLLEALDKLDSLYEAMHRQFPTETGRDVDISTCRTVPTDVVDIRGEYETNACIDYYPAGSEESVLTRVQVRTVIVRNTDNGKEFLCKKNRFGFQLPGGGYDVNKDGGNILNTASREAYEEFNIKLTNLKDSGVRVWRYREDPWVAEHVADPADIWNGYYSIYVTAEVESYGNNENPEDINKFKWYPIDDLYKAKDTNYRQVAATLSEAFGDGSHGEQDYTIPGAISYCCESPAKLAMILDSGLIKASAVPETHETDIVKSGKRGRPKYKMYNYVSFSNQLYSHAYRRPNKWSFGILLDEAKLASKGYKFTDRDQTYNSLQFSSIFPSPDGHYMAKTTLFGYVEITKEIFDIIYEALKRKSDSKGKEFAGNTDRISNKSTLTKERSWDLTSRSVDKTSYRDATTKLTSIPFDTKIALAGSGVKENQYSVSISEFSPKDRDLIMDYLINETYYNEGERRVWCKNGEDGVHFDTSELYGIILPKVIEPVLQDIAEDADDAPIAEELVMSDTQYDALEYIYDFVQDNNLEFYIHDAADEYHMAKLDIDRGIKTKGTR